jgi:hypothetical protein
MFPWLGHNVVVQEVMDPWPYPDGDPAAALVLDRETPSRLIGGSTEVDANSTRA